MKAASVERINHTAVILFAKRGLAATSIHEISKEAGISIGLMYHYYKSKEDLYTELVKIAVTSANGMLKQLETEAISPSEKIRTFTANLLSEMDDENSSTPYYFILMAQTVLNSNFPKITKDYTGMAFDSFYTLKSIIEAGQAVKEIKNGDSEALTTLYLSIFHGLCSF